MVEGARLEIVYVPKGASRVRIPLSPPESRKGRTFLIFRDMDAVDEHHESQSCTKMEVKKF